MKGGFCSPRTQSPWEVMEEAGPCPVWRESMAFTLVEDCSFHGLCLFTEVIEQGQTPYIPAASCSLAWAQ